MKKAFLWNNRRGDPCGRPRSARRGVAGYGAIMWAGLLFGLVAAHGEQVKRFGNWRVHYIAFNASVLSAETAERYDIVRGSNKALVNITAVGPSGQGEKVTVRGKFKNLLDQSTTLDFREIDDKGTVYYLAAFDFEHAENLRFEITVDLPKHGTETFRFQQPLYRDREKR